MSHFIHVCQASAAAFLLVLLAVHPLLFSGTKLTSLLNICYHFTQRYWQYRFQQRKYRWITQVTTAKMSCRVYFVFISLNHKLSGMARTPYKCKFSFFLKQNDYFSPDMFNIVSMGRSKIVSNTMVTQVTHTCSPPQCQERPCSFKYSEIMT